MKLEPETAEELASGISTDEYKHLAYRETRKARWHTEYEVAFEHEGKQYAFLFMSPATEMQEDMDNFTTDSEGMVSCWPVKAVEETITRYVPEDGE